MSPVVRPLGRRGRSRPASFTTGLRVLFEAENITGLADGAAVSTWPDASGNGYDATQTGATCPTWAATGCNGRPAVAFAGGTQWMDSTAINANPPLTVIILANSTDIYSTGQFLYGTTADGNGGLGLSTDNSGTTGSFSASVPPGGGVYALGPGLGRDYIQNVNPWSIMIYTVDTGGNYTFMLDGQVSASGQSANAMGYDNTRHLRVGGTNHAATGGLRGAMAYLAVYNRVLTITEMTQADAALRQKYGLPAAMSGVLQIPNPTTTDNVTHPDVQYFATPWNGYSYWMAMTPFPINGDENPHILVSNDGNTWTAPPGLTNPVVTLAQSQAAGYGYNSDTELLLVGSTMEMYSRYAGGPGEGITRITSTDGVTWTSPQIIITSGSPAATLSPSLYYDGTTRYMWTVDNTTNKLQRRTSTDGATWSAPTNCTVTGIGSEVLWHHNVVYYGGTYQCFLTTWRPYRSRYLTSSDGLTWTSDGKDVVPLSGTAWDAGGHYRSAFLPLGGGLWDVWLAMMNYNQTGGEGDWKLRRLQITLPRP